jgi:hypothetical protein
MNKKMFRLLPKEEQEQYFNEQKLLLVKQVKLRINTYAKFDICSFLDNLDALIFGGCVRDSIADLEIHDVDILALPKTATIVANKLIEMGYKQIDKYGRDICEIYINSIIDEPWNFYSGDSFIQIIRPRFFDPLDTYKEISLSDLGYIAGQVDLSCCGVCFKKDKICEFVSGAINDCKNKQFRIMETAKMKTDRIFGRIDKLEKRGWTDVSNGIKY